MRFKYTISLVFIAAFVIIEKENNIISRVSNKLTRRQIPRIPQPSNFSRLALLKQHGSYSSLSELDSEFKHLKRRLENYTIKMDNLQGGKKHIILMATTRTGSSFVGEFFNQQGSNMFYLFEPLWHIDRMFMLKTGQTNPSALAKAHQDVLQQLLLCDFTLLENFIQPPPKNHITTTLFRRESSKSLCEKPVCTPFVKKVVERFPCKTRRCGPLNLALASKSCHQKEYRAIKTVRVHQLGNLRPLMENPFLNIKLIQLVRDPRAVLASRMVAFSTKYKTWKKWAVNTEVSLHHMEIKKLKANCDEIRTSAELGLKQPVWLQRRYMLVRYEDIARYPLKKAAEMYRFTGIPFTSQVKQWILKNTHVLKETAGVYSTRKNSSEHVEKWRFSIPFKLAKVVQRVCGSAMKLFGYRTVHNEAMLTDKSISLIEEKNFKLKK
ncbi:carbohydrate sulfotransferase 3-like [Brienomyrus brachyistius]|uniref:carbohydrate sulfotransferase 3-like n=1 Tax=Brienomyrus brachyistius TaxID=42636 RepID=UPI0020B42AD7|nr:carbohydrate sulfotransferase 3-like [Brienomyrus brachyistius]XP_048844154.1 carbohydrate sulfotransferase 3-like [Brienomyrus brachyistius]XP_048844155.1 carbohydrate sulfotransferase 3-like [Brienomyrus brachyistius]XP_048844156.1 carbohydrate sulfotransferase 3-like [Brienomyrus brachyistius]XP_048844157.1 carbohydrate sulfotransferase 3-like [Brienomyrus brachyistius]XP_048844159.1 carbohydrate sulfotransferase 3-like [Brienomyrus brachyistius]XP_048844160.1 carbohydrate sulfotransfer